MPFPGTIPNAGADTPLRGICANNSLTTITKENMHHIELIGSFTTATMFGGEEIRITTTRKDPVPVLCRELIKRGVDPQDPIHVTRAGSPVWTNDRTIAAWAGIDVKDYDQRGLRTERYQPSPYSDLSRTR